MLLGDGGGLEYPQRSFSKKKGSIANKLTLSSFPSLCSRTLMKRSKCEEKCADLVADIQMTTMRSTRLV